jgi:hypothetical protein
MMIAITRASFLYDRLLLLDSFISNGSGVKSGGVAGAMGDGSFGKSWPIGTVSWVILLFSGGFISISVILTQF